MTQYEMKLQTLINKLSLIPEIISEPEKDFNIRLEDAEVELHQKIKLLDKELEERAKQSNQLQKLLELRGK